MLNRFFVIFFLSALFACEASPEKQSSTNSKTEVPNPSARQADQEEFSSFSRLHSSTGQTIYVPVYSHIYQQNHKTTFNLTTTLSIRNADMNRSFTLSKVLYYDSQGELVKDYLEEPMNINPLASTSFVVNENDLRGGVGANFIVVWESANPVYPPVIEAVMISTSMQQGISFISVGRVLQNQNTDSLNSK
jgi:hypothetical protein